MIVNEREFIIILGALNQASGYPYQKFLDGVLDDRNRFSILHEELFQDEAIRDLYIDDVLLALKQEVYDMDQYDLFAIQDDVTLEEVGELVKKIGEYKVAREKRQKELDKISGPNYLQNAIKRDLESGGTLLS